MEVTTGMVGFGIMIIGALVSGFLWIWNLAKDKVVRDKDTDTMLNNHAKAILEIKSEGSLKIEKVEGAISAKVAEGNLKIEKIEVAINAKVDKAEIVILKAQKSSKKKLVKQLQAFDAELKRFEKHELDIQRISNKQTQYEKDLTDIKRQVNDTLRAVQANSEISAGILANVENINKQYDNIIQKIESKSK